MEMVGAVIPAAPMERVARGTAERVRMLAAAVVVLLATEAHRVLAAHRNRVAMVVREPQHGLAEQRVVEAGEALTRFRRAQVSAEPVGRGAAEPGAIGATEVLAPPIAAVVEAGERVITRAPLVPAALAARES